MIRDHAAFAGQDNRQGKILGPSEIKASFVGTLTGSDMGSVHIKVKGDNCPKLGK